MATVKLTGYGFDNKLELSGYGFSINTTASSESSESATENIMLGSTALTAVNVGSSQVTAIYVGSTLVWGS